MLKCHCSNGGSPFAPEDELNAVSKHIGVICTVSLRDGHLATARGKMASSEARKQRKDPVKTHFPTFCVFNTIAIIVSLNNSVLVRHR